MTTDNPFVVLFLVIGLGSLLMIGAFILISGAAQIVRSFFGD